MRRAAAALLLAALLTATAAVPPAARAEYRGSTIDMNVGPQADLGGGSADRFPTGHYKLDEHTNVDVADTLTGDPSSVGDSWQQTWATWLGDLSFLVLRTILSVFAWAFTTDFLTGHGGVLPAVDATMQRIHRSLISQGWMLIAVMAMAAWTMWKLLVQRRAQEAASGLAVSLMCAAFLGAFVLSPSGTLGGLLEFSNGARASLLGGFSSAGSDVRQARRNVADTLNDTFVYRIFAVLETGGLKHCVDPKHPDKDGFPTQVSPGTQGATCRDHMHSHDGYGGYVPLFLKYGPGSDERNMLYKALKDGSTDDAAPQRVAPGRAGGRPPAPIRRFEDVFPGLKVDKADALAVDVMQAKAAGDRLQWSAFFAFGTLWVTLLFGYVILVVLVAAVGTLFLAMLSPAVALIGLFPAAHRTLKWWLVTFTGLLLIGCLYALVLGALVSLYFVLGQATTAVPMKLSWLLLSVFSAFLFFARGMLVRQLGGAITGHQISKKDARMLGAFTAYQSARRVVRSGLSQRIGRQADKDKDEGEEGAREPEASAVSVTSDAPVHLPRPVAQSTEESRDSSVPSSPKSESRPPKSEIPDQPPPPQEEGDTVLPEHARKRLAERFKPSNTPPVEPLPEHAQKRLKERFSRTPAVEAEAEPEARPEREPTMRSLREELERAQERNAE